MCLNIICWPVFRIKLGKYSDSNWMGTKACAVTQACADDLSWWGESEMIMNCILGGGGVIKACADAKSVERVQHREWLSNDHYSGLNWLTLDTSPDLCVFTATNMLGTADTSQSTRQVGDNLLSFGTTQQAVTSRQIKNHQHEDHQNSCRWATLKMWL